MTISKPSEPGLAFHIEDADPDKPAGEAVKAAKTEPLGAAEAKALLARGHEVRVLDSLVEQVHGSTQADTHWPEVEVQIGDVRDGEEIAVTAGADGLLVGGQVVSSNRPRPEGAALH